MQYLKSAEVPTDTNESEIVIQGMLLATPEHDGGIMMLHPFTIGLMEIDRGAAECSAPLHHACVLLRMRNRDG